jgi:hypothetical protein
MNIITPLDVNEYGTHGTPIGAALVIGFTEVYFTLWRITRFAGVEHCHYLQNLSIDFAKAQHKVSELLSANGGYYGHDFEVDLDLRGDNGHSYFRKLAAKRYEPYQLAISRFAGTDMRTIDANEEYFSGYIKHKYGVEPEYKRMSGLLWATYLNKEENTVRGLRRRVIARSCLVNTGILVRVGREYLTPAQIKTRKDRELKEAAINGHHEVDGKRISIKVRAIGKAGSFDTQYGTTYIQSFIDENGRLFKYMGSNLPDIGEEFSAIKATVKHDTYKDQQETKLQRIKLL